jgi:hypothetical protein
MPNQFEIATDLDCPQTPILGALKRLLAWLPQYWGLGGGLAESVSFISEFGVSILS